MGRHRDANLPPPPNPMHVQQIIDFGLGYPREQIILALQQNRDNVERAVTQLLSEQPRGRDFPIIEESMNGGDMLDESDDEV